MSDQARTNQLRLENEVSVPEARLKTVEDALRMSNDAFHEKKEKAASQRKSPRAVSDHFLFQVRRWHV